MEVIDGVIKDYDQRGILTITAQYDNYEKFARCGYRTARIILNDSREISHEQRKKIYAILGEIAAYTGDAPESIKRLFKVKFVAERQKELAETMFSLSDCSVTLASEYLEYLIDFILLWDIPTRVRLIELCDDIPKYVYACFMHKKCAVCGKKAELHHVDAVGMGNDRTKIDHIGMRALPLCRAHHDEIHNIGTQSFLDRYHLETVKIDEKIAKKYRLSGGKKSE